jgi:ABC-type Zn uptake system ZnuABC Zn-binding protein ZnuA
MKFSLLAIFLNSLFLLETGLTADKLNIVTTLPDLAYIVEEIGGAHVDAFAIARGYQDPHFVDAKPSFVLKLKNADMFVQIGLDLEVGWVPPLLETSRNRDIYFGSKGYVDASNGIDLLQIPQIAPGDLRAQGDIHVFGNPHYWLDPENGIQIAKNICERLIVLRPGQAAYFNKNLHSFSARIDSAMQEWQTKLSPYKGAPIIAYHNSWPYFEKRFGLNVIAFVEPKPGIPPPPSHLVSVINKANEMQVKAIIISPYFDDKPAQAIAGRTNARVVHVAPSVGAFKEIKTYFDVFDYNVNALLRAFEVN